MREWLMNYGGWEVLGVAVSRLATLNSRWHSASPKSTVLENQWCESQSKSKGPRTRSANILRARSDSSHLSGAWEHWWGRSVYLVCWPKWQSCGTHMHTCIHMLKCTCITFYQLSGIPLAPSGGHIKVNCHTKRICKVLTNPVKFPTE